jgi:hypothetical protein
MAGLSIRIFQLCAPQKRLCNQFTPFPHNSLHNSLVLLNNVLLYTANSKACWSFVESFGVHADIIKWIDYFGDRPIHKYVIITFPNQSWESWDPLYGIVTAWTFRGPLIEATSYRNAADGDPLRLSNACLDVFLSLL